MLNIEIIKGDITKLTVDAIVNAANVSLCGGGGVDGAVHRAAGKALLAECRTLGGCNPGYAKITPGYELPAKFIIHAVGPVWDGGHKNEEAVLSSCYLECLKIAVEKEVNTIAFPAISCGSYKFPVEKACKIAINQVVKFLSENHFELKVIFVCFNETIEKAIHKALAHHQVIKENG